MKSLQNGALESSFAKSKEKKHSPFLEQLESTFISKLDVILNMALPIPLFCSINNQGFVREAKTGTYLSDENRIPIRVTRA
jgi:hypothetical protein